MFFFDSLLSITITCEFRVHRDGSQLKTKQVVSGMFEALFPTENSLFMSEGGRTPPFLIELTNEDIFHFTSQFLQSSPKSVSIASRVFTFVFLLRYFQVIDCPRPRVKSSFGQPRQLHHVGVAEFAVENKLVLPVVVPLPCRACPCDSKHRWSHQHC